MKVPLHTKIGIGLILIGIGPFLFVEYKEHARNWMPLDAAVIMKPGEVQLPLFKTDVEGRYLVSLAPKPLRGRDLIAEQCMMGVGSAWDCGDVKQTVDFDWQIVSDDGLVVQSGSYKPTSISGARIGFAEFEGHRGAHQRLVLKIHRDADELNRDLPRIIVETAPEAWEALPYLYIISRYWAGVVSIVGALVIVLGLWFGRGRAGQPLTRG